MVYHCQDGCISVEKILNCEQSRSFNDEHKAKTDSFIAGAVLNLRMLARLPFVSSSASRILRLAHRQNVDQQTPSGVGMMGQAPRTANRLLAGLSSMSRIDGLLGVSP